jgi:hypothetical protein
VEELGTDTKNVGDLVPMKIKNHKAQADKKEIKVDKKAFIVHGKKLYTQCKEKFNLPQEGVEYLIYLAYSNKYLLYENIRVANIQVTQIFDN